MTQVPNLSIIVACDKNRGIGQSNELLSHIRADLQRFKTLTSGHSIIMGRNTWDSLTNKPLPKRRNIVLTHDQSFQYDVPLESTGSMEIAHSISEVMFLVKDEEEVFVIGGGQIYDLFMPFTKTIYITQIHKVFPEADTFFPEIDKSSFKLVEKSETFTTDDGIEYSFLKYERV